jgi:hypothetical protein
MAFLVSKVVHEFQCRVSTEETKEEGAVRGFPSEGEKGGRLYVAFRVSKAVHDSGAG